MTQHAPDLMGFRGTFTIPQTKQLLAPIRPERVLRDPRGHSHVSQQDITAHLIRVFGFGNFATEVLDLTLLFEEQRPYSGDEPWKARWDVGYRCTMRLSIFDEKHNLVTSYEDSAGGDGQNLTRFEAHDIAMKTAVSTAKKRCCINLGDQFGLSLYNKGQMSALVTGTHVTPPKFYDEQAEGPKDVQEGVEQQVSMGHDEIEKDAAPTEEEAQANLEKGLGATKVEEPEEAKS